MNTKYTQYVTLFVILIFVTSLLSIAMPSKFLTVINIQSMVSQFPEFGLLALAMMLAMITGGIDLSVVAIANLAGVVAAYILSETVGPSLPVGYAVAGAVLAVVLVSGFCGLINGVLIAQFRVPPLLATLGSSGLFMGSAIIITKGGSISSFPEEFLLLGSGNILGIPVPFLLFVIVAILISILLGHTRQGFNMYMVGSNPTVSRFSGINNKRVLIKTYILVALLAGLAALIIASRVNSMRPGYGEAYLLPAILVAVLGGTDPDGGYGNILGVVMAIFILQLLQSGLNILSFSPFLTKFLWGAALLLVMVINRLFPIFKESMRVRKLRAGQQLSSMKYTTTQE